MADGITTKAGNGTYSGTEPRPDIKDPDLLREYESLETPEDRADFLEAVQTLAELDEDELVPWEDVKAELGY
jgi:hypothetical protein